MRERLRAWWTPRTQLSIGFGGGIGFLYLADTTGGHWTSTVFLVVHGGFLAIGYSAVQTIMERPISACACQTCIAERLASEIL